MPNQYTKAKTEQAIAERHARQEAAGIPDSAPPIADADTPREDRLRGLHYKGTPVEDVHPEIRCHLRFEMTDEGIELRERELQVLREQGKLSRIDFESEQRTNEKLFGRMAEQMEAGCEYSASDDPFRAVMDQHLKPGEVGRMLDGETRDRLGMDIWTPVLDPQTGDKVQVGGSFLAKTSAAKAEARDRYYERRAQESLARIVGETQEQAEQLAHAQKSARVADGKGALPYDAGLTITRDIEALPSQQR